MTTAWSSQEWKTDIETYERSGRPDTTSWKMVRKVRPGHEGIRLDGTAQSVRNEETPRDRSERPDIDSQEEARPQQFVIGTMAVTMESAAFMGKNYQNKCHSIVNTTDLTLKQMFDITTKLVSEQDEISGLETISWENHSWRYLSLIGDERIINLQSTKVYVFSDSCCALGRF